MIARAAPLALALLAVAACAPRVVHPGPPILPPTLTDSAFVAADGAVLPARAWQARAPVAQVLALHGFNDHSAAFTLAGAYLAARGISVYAYDQRGFGAAPHHGLWAGADAMVADLRAVAAALRARHPDRKLFVLGESMGGAVAIAALAGPQPPAVDGVILAAPALWGRETMPWIQTAALWAAAHTVPWLTVSGRGLDRLASDNIPMLRALGRDPLVIRETRIDAIHGLVALMDAAFAGIGRLPAPALVLYGARDEIIPPAATRRAWARLTDGGSGRRLALYPEGWHMLLRDLQAEAVLDDIAAWIRDADAPLASGAEADARERLAGLDDPRSRRPDGILPPRP